MSDTARLLKQLETDADVCYIVEFTEIRRMENLPDVQLGTAIQLKIPDLSVHGSVAPFFIDISPIGRQRVVAGEYTQLGLSVADVMSGHRPVADLLDFFTAADDAITFHGTVLLMIPSLQFNYSHRFLAAGSKTFTVNTIIFVDRQQVSRSKRNLRVLQVDGSCKTTSLRYTLIYLTTFDGNWMSTTADAGFLRSETSSASNFIWSVALLIIYGPWMRCVTTTLSDGDDTIYKAIDAAISSSLCGIAEKTSRRRCFWHQVLLLQKLNIDYSTVDSRQPMARWV